MLRLPRHLWLTFPALILFAPVCLSQLAPPAAQTPQASPTLLTAFMRRDTASSAWSADNVSYDFYAFDIYVNDLTKRKTTRLTKDGLSSFPVLSPDGSRIVFIRRNEVTVANSDGSNVRTLAVLPSPAYSMFWSPDSTMLAYMVADSHETLAGKLYIFRVDSDDSPVLFGSSFNSNIEWSPNSRSIAYQCPAPREHARPQLCVAQVSDPGSVTVLLATVPGPYEWSADSRQVNFVSLSAGNAGLSTVHPDEPRPLQIAPMSSLPDRQVAFAPVVIGPWNLTATQIADLFSGSGNLRIVVGDVPYSAPHLDQSRDGRILFSDSAQGGASIFTVRADGSSRHRLTEPKLFAASPIWLSDFGQIAFSGIDHHDRKVFVMNSDGSSVHVVSPARFQQCVPQSAPPHTTLLFMICGNSAFNPPSHGLFAHRLDVMDDKDRSLFVADLSNPNSKPKLVANKIYGDVSVAAFSPSPHARSLDSLAPSGREN